MVFITFNSESHNEDKYYISKCCCFFVSFIASSAENRYVINNYEGTIGGYPVHVSLQKYDFGEGTNIEGSYYYDKHRSPIPLFGKVTSTSMELCEVNNKKEYDAHIVDGRGYNSNACQFKLITGENGIDGTWSDKNTKLPVRLTLTNSLSNSTFLKISHASIEIPFWGQTSLHSFIGVYEINEGEVNINRVNVLNKKTGVIDQVIDPKLHGCNFGFYMTSIYQNIESDSAESQVLLNCYSTGSDVSVVYRFNSQKKVYSVIDQ